jgi:hypothetical protein
MLDRVRAAAGEIFEPVETYVNSLAPYWPRIDRFDKLERIQHFREPDDASWRAFAAGDWDESLRLSEQNRPEVVAEFAEDARLGYRSYRVRVVDLPIDPYLQWEMDRFRIRVECGESIRIVGPTAVADYETTGIVPELIFMGSLAMYEVRYDKTGELVGGKRFTDPELIVNCRAEVQALYASGEDFWSFYEREIVPLAPPARDPEYSRFAGS